MNKRVVYAFILILIIFIFSITIRYAGFVVQSVHSGVTIDTGIFVNVSGFDGSTTDFESLNDAELQDIKNLTLEKAGIGKIIFSEKVNLTSDAVNNTVEISVNVNVSYNRIYVNTTALGSLEKTAVLYLYGLNFSNPRVLKNGVVCSNCVILSYSNILVFSVPEWNLVVYSAEETPAEQVAPTVGAGGGGGSAEISNFSVDKDLVKVLIKQGETRREKIKITNRGNRQASFKVELKGIEKFVALSEDEFSLKPGETRIINLDFFAKDEEIADSYVGRILISSGGLVKSVNVILEIKEKKPLFDVSVDVLDKLISPGKKVQANISIVNLGDLRNIDILLYYALKDYDGNILNFREESLAINKTLSVIREIDTGEYTGNYVFYAKVYFGNISAASSDNFEIPEKKVINIGGIFAIVCIILAILYVLLRKKYSKKKRRRITF